MGPFVERVLTIRSNGSAPLNKMAVMSIYGKCFKIVFSRAKKALRLNFWYIALETEGLSSFFKWS